MSGLRWVLLFGLGACWPGPLPDCPDCARNDDLDADGFSPAEGDCDDDDPTRHPAALERCDDGVDQDCDGTAAGCRREGTLSLLDADRVVWGGQAGLRLGEDLARTSTTLWARGDGLLVRLPLPLVDGELDAVATLADGDPVGPLFGMQTLVAVGTTDQVDLVPGGGSGSVTATGTVSGVRGAFAVGATDGLLGEGEDGLRWLARVADGALSQGVPLVTDGVVGALLVADLDLDGVDDLVVGLPETGEVVVVSGPVETSVDLATVEHRWTGTGTGAGRRLALLQPGVLFVGGAAEGWVLSGQAEAGELDAVSDSHLLGADDSFGVSVVSVDLDADGEPDLAVGSPERSEVDLWYGPLDDVLDTDSPDLRIQGTVGIQEAGRSLAALDVDGDGVQDLLVGSPADGRFVEAGGSVSVVSGRGL